MTMAVAIWCRHKDDNIIGTGNHLPWCIESDSKRFWDVVTNQNMVCGRKTYQSIPQEKLFYPQKIFVLSNNADFEVFDTKKHLLISSQKRLENNLAENEDIYIAGGAQIYELFMQGKEKFKPHIIVDCVYEGELLNIDESAVNITSVINEMQKKYRKITPDYCQDNVASAIWIRKGEFVEQSVLKRLVQILEQSGEEA